MARYLGKATILVGLLAALELATGCGPGPHILYGFMDAQGNWVVPPKYDEAYPFSGGLAAVKKGGRWGYIDAKGRTLVEPVYLRAYPFSEGLAAVSRDAGWMFIDTAGETVIPGPFENAHAFADGLAAVETDGKWGFINRQGKLAIPVQFDELNCGPGVDFLPTMPSCFGEGLAAVRLGERWGYIDRLGSWVIEPRFQHARSFSEGLAAACEPAADDACVFGYIDRRGNWAIAPRFLWAMHFSGGRAIALVERNDPPQEPHPATGAGPEPVPRTVILIDAAGKEIADLDWKPLLDNFEEAAWIIDILVPGYLAEGLVPATEGNRWGYRDRDGQWRIEPKYAFAMPFRHGVAAVGLSGDPEANLFDPDRWELVDTQGRRIGLPGLAMVGGGAGPLFLGQLYSRWGLLDRDGRWRVLPVYAEEEGWLDLPIFRPGAGDGLYRMGVHANHRWILADTRGRKLGAGEFQWIDELRHPPTNSAPQLSFMQNGLWGLMDSRLKAVTAARFDQMTAGTEGLLEVTLDGRVGCMDRAGRWVVPAEFDEIFICGRDRVRGRRGADTGTWIRASGWTPDAPGKDPEAAESVYTDSVRISDQVVWHKEGDQYSLFRGAVPALEIEPADQVRHVEMRFAGQRTPVQLAVVRRGASWSVLDEAGRPWLPGSYDGIGKMYDGLVAAQKKGRWGIVDTKGRDLFPGGEDELQPFARDLAIFCRDERCGLLDRGGRIVLPPAYRSIMPLSRTHARVGIPDPDPNVGDALVGVIDGTGRVIVEPVYRRIERFSDTVWKAIGRQQVTHLLSVATGEPVPGLNQLVDVGALSEGLAAATLRVEGDTRRSGYIDAAGRIVIPPRFDDAGAAAFQKGAALVTIDGRCGAIDRRGKLIVPAEHDHCSRLSDDKILAGAETGAPPLEPFLKTAPAGIRQ